jgi:3-polyprenyl-4-hydroxybenzoate decarboxylase
MASAPWTRFASSDVESHLVVTKAALLTLQSESELTAETLGAKADVVHRLADVGASIASGSFRPWACWWRPAPCAP